ncbi:hypothetical protein H113_01353 [Trichophyton rubrum MR1459]|uniref:Uncharacterized protein n=2 Tax=Trichophyton TaxID=5550 RepID=A0A080WNW1_TRIRC|nr:uncharacterized protein TERG_12500 [Trichophyton rubrum CBS 118892]EZF77337.1 hypothetical protein H105_01360 [Trichophyton soudanense CBS 452.61]EZF98786.1 hypothetical protein H113_01353 [Trichophyton rubrum MR1459]KFL62547.1 hypothetical protein TERG_12500 [Trichophyton rubrum CBS 118892]
MPARTQAGAPVHSNTREKPWLKLNLRSRAAARSFAAWSSSCVDVAVELGGSRAHVLMQPNGSEEAMSSLAWLTSASTIVVKCCVTARADARSKPMAPAPNISTAVSLSGAAPPFAAATDLASATSSAVGGLERLIACRQTARGSSRAPCTSEMEAGKRWHIATGWLVTSISVPSRWGNTAAELRNLRERQMLYRPRRQ